MTRRRRAARPAKPRARPARWAGPTPWTRRGGRDTGRRRCRGTRAEHARARAPVSWLASLARRRRPRCRQAPRRRRRGAVTGVRRGGEAALRVGDEDVSLGPPIGEAEARIGRIGVGNEEPSVDRAHTQEPLSRPPSAHRLAGPVPVERNRKERPAIDPAEAADRRAVGAERLVRVRRVEVVAEWPQVADSLERKRRPPDLLEMKRRGQRTRRGRRRIVVAVRVVGGRRGGSAAPTDGPVGGDDACAGERRGGRSNKPGRGRLNGASRARCGEDSEDCVTTVVGHGVRDGSEPGREGALPLRGSAFRIATRAAPSDGTGRRRADSINVNVVDEESREDWRRAIELVQVNLGSGAAARDDEGSGREDPRLRRRRYRRRGRRIGSGRHAVRDADELDVPQQAAWETGRHVEPRPTRRTYPASGSFRSRGPGRPPCGQRTGRYALRSARGPT